MFSLNKTGFRMNSLPPLPLHAVNSVVQKGLTLFKKQEEPKKQKKPLETARATALVNAETCIRETTVKLQQREREEQIHKAKREKESAEFDKYLEEQQKPFLPVELTIETRVDKTPETTSSLPAPELDCYFLRKPPTELLFGSSYLAQFLSALSPLATKVIDSLKSLLQMSEAFLELGYITDNRLTQKLQEKLSQTAIKQNDMNEAITRLNSYSKQMDAFKNEMRENLSKVSPFLRFFLNFVLNYLIKTAQDPLIEGLIKAKKDVISSIITEATSALLRLQGKKEQLDQLQMLSQPSPLVKTSNAAAVSPTIVPAVSPTIKTSIVTVPKDDITSLTIALLQQYTLIAPLVEHLKYPHIPDEETNLQKLAKIHLAKEEIEVTAANIMAKTHHFTDKEQTQILQFLLEGCFITAPDYVKESVEKLKNLEAAQQTLPVFMGLLLNQLHTDFETIKNQMAKKITDFRKKLNEAIFTRRIIQGKRLSRLTLQI